MSGINKLKHVVVLSDTQWQEYAKPIDGINFIGTLARGHVVGALGLQNGMYCCVIDGKIEHLNQRKAKLGVEHATAAP